MKISERQLHMLVALLHSSLEKNVVGYLCYDIKQRAELLNEIINQQDSDLFNINTSPSGNIDGYDD